jgi:AraC family transcriptional regulator
VYEYVLRRRVERAQLLLRNHRLSISEIALATGFAHQSHLARHMHRILGHTPSAVRGKRVTEVTRVTKVTGSRDSVTPVTS